MTPPILPWSAGGDLADELLSAGQTDKTSILVLGDSHQTKFPFGRFQWFCRGLDKR